jgi:hypothetical protein
MPDEANAHRRRSADMGCTDPGALAAEMARRGFLRADPGDGKPACRCSLPGRPKGARSYHVLPAIFADG